MNEKLKRTPKRPLWIIIVGFIVLLLGLISISVMSYIAANNIQRQLEADQRLIEADTRIQDAQAKYESLRLASEAIRIVDTSAETALLLSIRALKISDTNEARNSLTRALDNWHGVMSVPHAGCGAVASYGDWMIVGGNTPAIYDSNTGQLRYQLIGHQNSIIATAVSPDGQRIATGSADNTIIIWDASAQALRTFGTPYSSGYEVQISSLDFAQDGIRLVVATTSGKLMIYNSETGETLQTFEGHSDGIRSVVFSADDLSIFSAGPSGVFQWEVSTGRLMQKYEQHININAIALWPTGLSLLTASDDHRLIQTRIGSGEIEHIFDGHKDAVTGVAFSPDGMRMISASRDGTMIVWDTIVLSPLETITNVSACPGGISYLPDGVRAITPSTDDRVMVWDLNTQAHIFTDAGNVISIEWSQDDKFVVSSSYDNMIRYWDINQRRDIARWDGIHTWEIWDVALSPDGRRAVSGGMEGKLALWDVASGTPLKEYDGYTGQIQALKWMPDGRHFVSGASSSNSQLWNADTGELVRSFYGGLGVTSVSLSADASLLLSSGHDDTIRLWEVETGAFLRGFGPLGDVVLSSALSPDGKWVVGSSYNRTITLWDANTGSRHAVLQGSREPVSQVQFSPDSRLIAGASADHSVLIWDAATGELLYTLLGHKAGVNAVAFSSDGTRLLSGGADATIRLWYLSAEDTIQNACNRVMRELTDSEKTIFRLDNLPTCTKFLQP